jgi:ParB family chromosome partitioning protein
MREDLHPIENAIAIKHILENKIVESQNKLAEYVGLSKGYVSKLMNILKLPSSVIQIIKNDNYKDVNILILLNKIESESEIIKIYNEIKNLARVDADKYIKNILNNTAKEKKLIVNYKKIKNKINLNIDTNDFSNEQSKILNEKFDFFNNELKNLINTWSQKNEN